MGTSWNSSTKKQRKSPENGDWKSFVKPVLSVISLGNKENLLKMEIESFRFISILCSCSIAKQRKSPENGDWKFSENLGINSLYGA